jgi:putative nucleotidyltransferase with HDIG domain
MAYYHDVGKMQRPYFFIENQPEGVNVHEKLDPQISAQIIISHVKDGLNLAKKYRLPKVIRDGIAQHHGTSLVKYFYYQALEKASQNDRHVDEADFHYPGPRPQTKENGILMLADVCESTVRALKPGSAEELDEIVQKVIADKLSSGELDDCDLTIADLYKIRTAFVDILQGIHHPRIKYPEQIQADSKTARAEEKSEVDRSPSTPESRAGKEVPLQTPTPLAPLTDPSTRPARLVRRE